MCRIIISLSCILVIQSDFVTIERAFGKDKTVKPTRHASPDPFLKPENTGEEGGHISEANILFTIDEADEEHDKNVVQKSVTEKKKKEINKGEKRTCASNKIGPTVSFANDTPSYTICPCNTIITHSFPSSPGAGRLSLLFSKAVSICSCPNFRISLVDTASMPKRPSNSISLIKTRLELERLEMERIKICRNCITWLIPS